LAERWLISDVSVKGAKVARRAATCSGEAAVRFCCPVTVPGY